GLAVRIYIAERTILVVVAVGVVEIVGAATSLRGKRIVEQSAAGVTGAITAASAGALSVLGILRILVCLLRFLAPLSLLLLAGRTFDIGCFFVPAFPVATAVIVAAIAVAVPTRLVVVLSLELAFLFAIVL
ncbi:MAG TPA: hypothetical protein VHG52_12515, partial [Thermomicrobiales bacterium]|nr:hypothetical protein [Thermomicrobiales bacterium]